MKVIIGGIPYEIQRVHGLHTADGVKLNGQIDCNEFVIRIDSDLNEISAQQTLWHEIVHGILMHNGNRKHDEELVDSLAYGILGVLMSNKKLMDIPRHTV